MEKESRKDKNILLIASLFEAASYIPLIARIIKHKNTDHIDVIWIILLLISSIITTIYFFITKDYLFLINPIISLIAIGSIIFMKILIKNKPQ